LHLGLAGDQPGQDVVAKREIGGGRRRPHAEDDDGADHDLNTSAELTCAVMNKGSSHQAAAAVAARAWAGARRP
jgi:hypothetical protein